MSSHSHDMAVPRGPLIGAGALILTVLAAAGLGRMAGAGTTAPQGETPTLTRSLGFEDRADGAILVRDAEAGREIALLEPGTNGFVRGTLRALVRDRRREEITGRAPFRLAAWPDGRLTLEDPATGISIGLEAFGPTNMEAFARLLLAGRDVR
jgi:putative photosynthetic complex assembly protein